MDVSFCVSALEEALAGFGKPDIFNTDQSSQFTSAAFTGVLLAAGIKISMDGRGRWLDNVFILLFFQSSIAKYVARGRTGKARSPCHHQLAHESLRQQPDRGITKD